MSQPADHDPPFEAELERRYERALAQATSDRTIVGVDIGFVYDQRGRPTGALDARVHRRASGLVSPLVSHAETIDSLAYDTSPTKDGALGPGVRIGNPKLTFGTLGLIVFDADTNQPLILSSSHVLGVPGTSTSDAINLIPQGTEKPRAIATFVRAVNDVTGDAAVAKPIGALAMDLAQRGVKPVTIEQVAMPRLGDVVEKVGAATGRTCGVVDGLGRYFLSGDTTGMLGFRIVRATPNCSKHLAQAGDSGAAWYRQADNIGVGLHIGSDPSIITDSLQPAIACYLPLVLTALSINLMGHS